MVSSALPGRLRPILLCLRGTPEALTLGHGLSLPLATPFLVTHGAQRDALRT